MRREPPKPTLKQQRIYNAREAGLPPAAFGKKFGVTSQQAAKAYVTVNRYERWRLAEREEVASNAKTRQALNTDSEPFRRYPSWI